MPALTFFANFFRRSVPESMARALAFGWFLVAAGYVLGKVTPDPVIFGLISANMVTCLGLRSKNAKPGESADA